MVAGGDALGRIDDGRVALIDGALPGERVRIEVTANKADICAAASSRCSRRHRRASSRRACTRVKGAAVAVGSTSPTETQPQLKLDIIRDALNRIARIADPPLARTGRCSRPKASARRCARSSSTASPRSASTSRTIP